MRHHWLPRFEAFVAQVLRELRILHAQFAVSHEHRCNTKCYFLVCAPANDPVDGNFRTRQRSLGLCVTMQKVQVSDNRFVIEFEAT